MDARAAGAQRQGRPVRLLLRRSARLPLCLPARTTSTPAPSSGAAAWSWAKEELNAKTPVAPIDLTKDLSCPLLGLFGNDDRAPSPEQVNQHEAELKKHGKTYEFHRYDGAGHGFFYWHRPLYRPEQAMDGWSKVFAFFGKHLAK